MPILKAFSSKGSADFVIDHILNCSVLFQLRLSLLQTHLYLDNHHTGICVVSL